jgi:hypothetical protein
MHTTPTPRNNGERRVKKKIRFFTHGNSAAVDEGYFFLFPADGPDDRAVLAVLARGRFPPVNIVSIPTI